MTSALTRAIIRNNQDNYRLNKFNMSQLGDAYDDVKALLSSKNDRAHHTVGVFLGAAITCDKPVFVLSCDDMDKLIVQASPEIAGGSFKINSCRVSKDGTKAKTIWAQFTGLLLKIKAIEILKPQNGKSPAVIEIVNPEWRQMIYSKASDEMRLVIINSTLREKFDTLDAYKASILQDSNITRPQGLDTPILQYYNTTRVSEQHSESQSE